MPPRECHYDVLGVPRTAEYDEIRTAYRKMALKWHPDKNQDRIEEATTRFKLVSEAYKTLSNVQERAWYDSHREDILRGGDGTNDDDKDTSWAQPDIMPYFFQTSNASYRINDPENFYVVAGRCFTAVYEAEMKDAERRRVRFDNLNLPSSYGTSTTSLEDVRVFYSRWSNFISKMSFAWHDEHDVRGLESRDQRRYVEAENKKLRDAAQADYTATVRAFVEHVRHRDPRVAEMKRVAMEEKRLRAERDRVKRDTERVALAAQNAVKRANNQAYLEELEKHEAEREAVVLDDMSEEEGEGGEQFDHAVEWRCDLCQKVFRSESQLDNHDNSKKHKDAVKKHLRATGQQFTRKKMEPVVVEEEEEEHELTGEQVDESFNDELQEDDVAPKYIPKTREEEEEEAELERLLNAHKVEDLAQDLDNWVEKLQKNVAGGESTQTHVPSHNDDDDRNPTPPSPIKKTSGKQRREERQKRKEEQAGKNGGGVAVDDLTCGICGDAFPSRTKLFDHIREQGHAALKPADDGMLRGKSNKGKKR